MLIALQRRDFFLMAGIFFVLALVAIVVFVALPTEIALPVFLFATAAIFIFIILDLYRRLDASLDRQLTTKLGYLADRHAQDYMQVEALLSLFFTLKPDLPLPQLRRWAASPDFLRVIVESVLKEKPELVLDVSSGASTMIIARCLHLLGRGRVIAIDHDAEYVARTKALIDFHGLNDVAHVVHAPLRVFDLKGVSWLWYDVDNLSITTKVDLIVVDGPPKSVQEMARYPALPILEPYCDSPLILVDDGRRKGERDMVERWKDEFSIVQCEYLDTEKGTFVLRLPKPEARAPGCGE